MYLTLEIVSANGAALGANRRIVVGEKGAYIGRGRTNDWVIDDPYISREHACIRYVNGAFYLEGIGKNPLAVSDPRSTVPNNEPQILRSGERFFLDQYEIKATISVGNRVDDDPFSDEPGTVTPPSPASSSSWDSSEPLLPESANADDVLKAFGIKPVTDEPPVSPVALDQVSPIHENFVARPPVQPAATPKPAASGRSRSEDDWDHTHFSTVPPGPAKPPFEPDVPRPSARSQVSAPRPPRPVQPPQPQPRPAGTVFEQPPRPRPQIQEQRAPLPVMSVGESSSLAELLRAAGISGQLSPETAAELGQVFRIMVQGVMEALQARAEVKLQFRMQATRVQANDNNPLKFSPNLEHALHTLLVERNRGYLPTARAFQGAFQDLRDHQIAILAGIRAAFNSMLEQFDPGRLQEKLEGESKRGLLKAGKGRFQELYTEHFRTLTRDPDECFRRLFGEEFAEAYEKQLEVLKRAGGPQRD